MRSRSTLTATVIVAALTTTSVALSPVAAVDELPAPVPYIVGGTEVTPADNTPWLAAVIDGNNNSAFFGQFCTGVLISPTHVLTAAHCVEDEAGQPTFPSIDVAVGILDLSTVTPSDRHEIVATAHPSYDGLSGVDLAVLTLADPIINIEPLLIRPIPPGVGDSVTAYGWGGTLPTDDISNSYPEVAHQGTMTVTTDYGSISDCGFASGVEHTHQFCFGDPVQAVCFGDSGGPVVKFDGGMPSLVGITSQGPETCNNNQVDEIAERVIDSVPWIESFAGPAGCGWNPNSFDSDDYAGWTVPCWLGPASGAAIPFADVVFSFFYIEGVKWLWSNAITTGTSPVTFSPDDPVTRGQVAAFVWRFAGEPAATGLPFADVVAPWQVKPVAWLDTWGFTTGTTPTTFSPDDPVTRAQLVTFLWRLLGEPAPGAPAQFSDVGPGRFYTEAVGWAAETGITTGYPDGTFRPDQPVTRGEVATFLYRLAQFVEAGASP